MAIDVSFRNTITFNTTAKDVSRLPQKFIINEGTALGGLRVTQSDTPAMSVKVEPGTGYFYGSGSNANVMYEFESDANETVSIGASGVQARIDIICLKVDPATEVASIVAVAGTPSGSPAVPATPASHYKLAEVAVGISVTTITNANITDRRRSVFVAPTGARNQGLINGKIVPTVASNNLTVAIKTLTDTDPTATNPVGIWIGNQLRWITSSLSTTVNAGTNWLNLGSAELATIEVDLFTFMQWNSTTSAVNILVSRIPYARVMSDFVNSGTNEKGVFGIVNYNATDVVVNVGRFAATLSAGAGYTWTVPSFTNANLIQEPIYETRWLVWLPTMSASGSMTWTAVGRNVTYKLIGNTMHMFGLIAGTTGGTASFGLQFTIPLAMNEFSTGGILGGGIAMQDGVGTGSGAFEKGDNSSEIQVRRYDAGNFGLGANRVARVSMVLPI